MDSMMEDRSEIAFFDVETTVPRRQGQGFTILEFGAILVCPRKLVELESYSTLVRPSHLSLISSLSVRCNGITRDAVLSSPTFAQIAHKVYHILHGRIWAGHNILRFDCARIREAFAQIGMPPPQPKGTIDSLALLTQKFGRRAGDMKESSLPENNLVPPNAVTRHRAGISSRHGVSSNKGTHSSSSRISLTDEQGEAHPILSLVTCSSEDGTSNLAESDATESGSFNMNSFSDQITGESLGTDISMEEEHVSVSPEFLEPDQVSIPSITASFIPFFRGSQRIQLLHNDACLLLLCNNLKVRFGISTKFTDYAGRPRLSFVVDVPPSLCRVLEASDGVAQRLFADSGISGDTAIYATEMLKKEPSGAAQRLIFNRFDAAELERLINPGAILDAFISLDTYDYQQSAGIRLVAKKLIIHA
ncbi:Protein NEN1, partial [Cucurbita argyrosperma subsp. argyrosperma]